METHLQPRHSEGWRQEDQKFKSTLDYTAQFEASLTTWDPVSKTKTNQKPFSLKEKKSSAAKK